MEGFRRQRSYLQQTSTRLSAGLRGRRRPSNDDEVIEIDNGKDASDNIREILVHLVRYDCVAKARVMAYLNALARYYRQLTAKGTDVGWDDSQVIFCLRSCTLHKDSIVRAAAFRSLRYFIDSEARVEKFFEYQLDWCIVRSLDLHLANDTERTQAIRLCRHLVQLKPAIVPPSIVLPFVALAGDASKTNERMVLISLEFLCELAHCNPTLLAQCGGIQVLLQYIIQCHNSPRINESLLQTVLYLLNRPQTRSDCSPVSGLDQLLAPFTDSHYRHKDDNSDNSSERAEGKAVRLREERLQRCQACSQALLSALHSWPGLVCLSSPQNTALSSIVNSLQISTHATQKVLLQLIYKVFLLRTPKWTRDFEEALFSCDPCTPESSWSLQEGFVAAECLTLHKETCSRPNLIDNHLALLLASFTSYGILEALCEVVIQSDYNNSIWATILLGELLHMSFLLLPWCDGEQTHFLPVLVAVSTSSTHTREQRSHAHQAVEYLDRLHSLKKRRRSASSLHLNLLISFIPETEARSTRKQKYKSTKDKLESHLPQDSEDTLLQLIRESLVLVESNASQWDWSSINAVLKSSVNVLKKVEDYTLHRFLGKLLHFYNPSADNGYCTIRLDDSRARLYTSTGLLLLEKIITIDADESHRHLQSLLFDICHCLSAVRLEAPVLDAKLGLNNIYSHCCQNYFLFIGKLSQSAQGLSLLESTNVMQQLLDLVTITTQEVYVKLIVSSLDYTKEGICRIILSKALTATSENARLYTADFMRALLRLGVPYFSNWCMELLITQLYDQSKKVSMRSLSVINEACEDPANLISLIAIRPSVLHLGEMGSLLVTRYLSVQEGFDFLRSSNYLENELDKWHKNFNVEYGDVVDNLLAQSLSSYEKSYDDEVQRRSNAVRRLGKGVYVPPHLYGQLIQHSEGAGIVASLPYLSDYFDTVRNHYRSTEADIKQCKSAIWATGHIGSSVYGLAILDKQGIIPSLISIAESSEVLTLRGTAYYALGLIASTQGGVQRLAELDWRSVMNQRSEEWPVVSDQLLFSDPEAVREMRSVSQNSTLSQTSSSRSDSTDTESSRYDIDEGTRSRASTDELVDCIRMDKNEYLYEAVEVGDFEPAVKCGKSHSTSELNGTASHAVNHRRCSSDSVDVYDYESPPQIVIEEVMLSSTEYVSSTATGHCNGQGPLSLATPPVSVKQSTPVKSAIRHKASRSLVEVVLEPTMITKSRSLSWRSDVRECSSGQRSLKSTIRTESISSHIGSTDSAISQTSISPIEGDRPPTPLLSSPSLSYTMSLNREKQGKPVKRKTRFSSLQSPVHIQDSLPRGMYVTNRDELGQAAVRAMRRQASNASSNNSFGSATSVPTLTSKSTRMIKTLSVQGDIDTLTEARKMSDINQPITSSAVRYMGLALPLDVIRLFEVADGAPHSELGRTTPVSPGVLDTANRSIEGLELHSCSNCLKCHKLSNAVDLTASGNRDDSDTAVQSKLIDRHVNGEVSEKNPIGRTLLRKECIKFISTICSSIGVNAAEEGLLKLKEQFPDLFEDICLYSEVCAILSSYSFHLPARRFIQELFQDTHFDQVFDGVVKILNLDVRKGCCVKHQPQTAVSAGLVTSP